ncbi:M20/M25/M40 family metallo-hydrolase [Dethiothermospora halolimnae]|uniref:M20/M25/M40 family metallo-hydrolase n=1 Tax=Dethiothermospora halolimnae TaxID=3114390 RepID=UPI003CCB911B
MKIESKKFLEELLSTPSPSGGEESIQRKWLDYVKEYADETMTDFSGNAIAVINPDAEFKVMIAGHCDEIAFMVNYIDDNGFLSVVKAGGINPKLALGSRVRVLTKDGIVNGVVGVNAEHHGGSKGEVKIEDIYIDCGFENKEKAEAKINIGDYIIYDFDYNYLENNLMTARGLDNRTGAFIVAEVIKELKNMDCKVGVYAVSTVNEETNMGGAYFAGSGITPNMAIACDVTFGTDYPNLDKKKHGDVKLGNGPVLSKGAPINKKINGLLESTAEANDINIQYELTPGRTGTDADKIRLTGKGVPVALVSLPLRYMHSPSEVVSVNDIEEEVKLISNMIAKLKGNENLKLV